MISPFMRPRGRVVTKIIVMIAKFHRITIELIECFEISNNVMSKNIAWAYKTFVMEFCTPILSP